MFGFVGWMAGFICFAGWSGKTLALYVVFALMPLVVFLCTLIHELGHAAAALVQGGRIREFAVRPVRLSISPLRLGRMGRHSHGDLGGYVVARFDKPTIGGSMLYVAAGPAANMACAVIAWMTISLFPYLSLAWAAGWAVFAMSMALGLANLIPFPGSDGAHLYLLLRWRRRAVRNAARIAHRAKHEPVTIPNHADRTVSLERNPLTP